MLLFRLVFQNPFAIAEGHSADLDRLSRVAVPVFVRHQLEIANADQVILSLRSRLDGHVEKTSKLAIRFRPTSPYSAPISTRHPFVPARAFQLLKAPAQAHARCRARSRRGDADPAATGSNAGALAVSRAFSCHVPSPCALRPRPSRPLLVHPRFIAVTDRRLGCLCRPRLHASAGFRGLASHGLRALRLR